MHRSSRFNFWANLGEEQHLLFNGFSGALLELDNQERYMALDLFKAPCIDDSHRMAQALIEGGFLIPDSFDEVQTLLRLNSLECADHRALDVTIAPTYRCNFRCTYCYIDVKSESATVRMSHDIEVRLVKFLKHCLSLYEQVNISWFGGEPLVCLNTILRVSGRLAHIMHDQVQLRSFIATNGYFLTVEAARRLVEAGIHHFHITIDGPAHEHDRLRVSANGQGTFARIKKNLDNLLAYVPEAQITLRMNASIDSVGNLREILDQIPDLYRRRIQVSVTPIQFRNQTPSLTLYREINQVVRHAIELGYLYYDNLIAVSRRTFCPADKRYNFHIGNDGTLYKCSPSSDKPEVNVGFLNSAGLPELNHYYERWHRAPSVHQDCITCSYLCFCAGGCRLERLRDVHNCSCRDKYEDMRNLVINRYMAICNSAI